MIFSTEFGWEATLFSKLLIVVDVFVAEVLSGDATLLIAREEFVYW